MINCVSLIHGALMPPARSVCTDTQLMYGVRGEHRILSDMYTIIKNFINRLMQCRQNTVVSLMGSIQRCILYYVQKNNWQENITCERSAEGQGIIHAQKNERCNNHEYLTKIRKSEKSLQYSQQHNMIEASSDCNSNDFDNINYNLYQTFGIGYQQRSTHMTYGRDYTNHNFRNYSINDDFF